MGTRRQTTQVPHVTVPMVGQVAVTFLLLGRDMKHATSFPCAPAKAHNLHPILRNHHETQTERYSKTPSRVLWLYYGYK